MENLPRHTTLELHRRCQGDTFTTIGRVTAHWVMKKKNFTILPTAECNVNSSLAHYFHSQQCHRSQYARTDLAGVSVSSHIHPINFIAYPMAIWAHQKGEPDHTKSLIIHNMDRGRLGQSLMKNKGELLTIIEFSQFKCCFFSLCMSYRDSVNTVIVCRINTIPTIPQAEP